MTLPIFSFLFCLLLSLNAQSQPTNITDSLPQQKNQPGLAPESKVFSTVEVEAEFPGGTPEWTKYLQKNLKANTPLKHRAPNGRYQVIVKFIVSKDGSIKDAAAETNHGYGMEEEVLRIIKKGPKWIPASQDGKTVNAYRRQPVTFVVR